jgi:protein-tyrosine kinase
VLLTSEARVLAGLVGQIAFVVRAGATPQQAVLDAINMLPENKDVGFILNQSDEGMGGDYYYDYYGQRGEEHASGS